MRVRIASGFSGGSAWLTTALLGGLAPMVADFVVMAAGMGLAEAAMPPAFVAIIGAFYRLVLAVIIQALGFVRGFDTEDAGS